MHIYLLLEFLHYCRYRRILTGNSSARPEMVCSVKHEKEAIHLPRGKWTRGSKERCYCSYYTSTMSLCAANVVVVCHGAALHFQLNIVSETLDPIATHPQRRILRFGDRWHGQLFRRGRLRHHDGFLCARALLCSVAVVHNMLACFEDPSRCVDNRMYNKLSR